MGDTATLEVEETRRNIRYQSENAPVDGTARTEIADRGTQSPRAAAAQTLDFVIRMMSRRKTQI